MTTSRRTWLRGGLGLGLGALCLPSLLPRGARAQAEAPVRRLLVVMTEHGAVYPRWRMRPGDPSEDADWEAPLSPLAEAEFSEILRPLHRHRARLSILDGLGNAVGMTTALNEHKEGHATALTGTQAVELENGPAHAQGPSIDQIVAAAIAEPGQIGSLQVSHGSWPYSYDPGGKTLPYIYEPAELYTRLFPDGEAPLSSDAAAIRARQSAVVELARAQFSAVAPRLGADDRLKVEQHRDLLRALELQLEALSQKPCEVPDPPGAAAPWEDPAWYDQRTQLFTTLTALALSCDLTRVGLLALWGLRNEQVGAPPGDIHNDFAHAVSSDPVAAQVMANFGRYHANDVAKLLDVLEDIPSAGGTLLDDTLVVWSSELGTPEHQLHRLPVVLAGGTGYFDKPGRYIHWRQTNVVPGLLGDELQGPPHNRLLVSIARAMGVERDAVGLTSVPLKNGAKLDCTGELDRLR
ncbi:DUF1552 domain-containing protein [Nannocystis bainbridge]|uniref:DUF1552 domain-containing protein n=1 Tax=Nannocystis bainbridge TaxID=2995303 RepID=A0ABT5E8T7_9BACT|nr:DUF1552 domain-containing protein [Nannocystis bainbridge]MDC0722273.1 DUF1552 domain-containing protein [Nannocystis bainbridge]